MGVPNDTGPRVDSCPRAPVAHRIERMPAEHEVAGSIPARRTSPRGSEWADSLEGRVDSGVPPRELGGCGGAARVLGCVRARGEPESELGKRTDANEVEHLGI